MNALLLLAHPRDDSFCHHLAERAAAGLHAGGHDVVSIDLYDDGFRAAMSPEERMAYHGERPVLDPMVARHQELLASAEIVVFVYPTWWSGLPAILKGWFERVFVPGIGFRFNDDGKVRPALTHVRHVVGISTYGSPRTAVRLVNDNGRRTITRALRMSCGLRTSSHWLGMYSVDGSTELDRREFAARVERTMADL